MAGLERCFGGLVRESCTRRTAHAADDWSSENSVMGRFRCRDSRGESRCYCAAPVCESTLMAWGMRFSFK